MNIMLLEVASPFYISNFLLIVVQVERLKSCTLGPHRKRIREFSDFFLFFLDYELLWADYSDREV
jgi:hypothetical protein